MIKRRELVIAALAAPTLARAHHGWSSFDQDRPIYLEGRAAQVKWRNPHVELMLEVPADLKLPADLAQRGVPAQSAQVDGKGLLARASLPRRKDRRWEVELAPLTRMEAWKVEEIKNGTPVGILGYTFKDEQGAAILRGEYLFVAGKVYGLRSSPA
jgi:hypothetical protein